MNAASNSTSPKTTSRVLLATKTHNTGNSTTLLLRGVYLAAFRALSFRRFGHERVDISGW